MKILINQKRKEIQRFGGHRSRILTSPPSALQSIVNSAHTVFQHVSLFRLTGVIVRQVLLFSTVYGAHILVQILFANYATETS